jgi:biopolymer transport protein ExbD
MAQRTLATIGLIVLVAAILVLWGTNHWIQTRTFDPVDMSVSLDAGQIRSGEFEINLRETYWVSIHIDDSVDDYQNDGRCSFRNLGSKRWRVFQLNPGSVKGRELWARSYDLDEGQDADGFRGIPGKYEVEWDVPPGATCLNARRPRLRVFALSGDYLEFGALLQYPCFFLGGIGAMLALRALWSWMLRFAPRPQLRIFPELVLRNVITWRRHRLAPPIGDMSNFGVVWSSILYVLMFTFWFAMIKPLPSHGLLVDLKQARSGAAQPSPWSETTSVYIGPLQFYVNGRPIERNKLRDKLAEALGKQMVWSVYLEADSDCTFGDAVYAMDTIRGLGATVVWITPKAREALTGIASH